MICDFCKKNEASIHLIKIQDNTVEKVNVCMDCARNYSFLAEEDFYDDLSQVLLKIFGGNPGESGYTNNRKIFRELKFSRNRKCPNCGIDLKTIKKKGLVGCSYCYSEFKNELMPVIRGLHGNLEHKGKIPVNSSRKVKLEKSIRDLKKRLRSEIIIENFEAAAKIRDEIKELEKNFYE